MSHADRNMLEGFGPFDTPLGQLANMIEIGRDEGGFMQLWVFGELHVWGPNGDPMGEPDVIFTPEDAPLLRMLADELESKAAEYAVHQAEKRAEASRRESTGSSPVPMMPATSTGPQIVTGAAASESLQEFALR